MKKKLMPIPKLIKRTHDAWSAFIRSRDGHCLMCGKTENLHAHHSIVPQKRGNATRFLADNGMALCYYCHMILFHKGIGGKEFFDRLSRIIDRLVTRERQEEIIRLSHTIVKYDRSVLEEIIRLYREKL